MRREDLLREESEEEPGQGVEGEDEDKASRFVENNNAGVNTTLGADLARNVVASHQDTTTGKKPP